MDKESSDNIFKLLGWFFGPYVLICGAICTVILGIIGLMGYFLLKAAGIL